MGTCFDLGRGVFNDNFGQRVQKSFGRFGVFFKPCGTRVIIFARRSTHHVKQKCPWSCRKSNQWNARLFLCHFGTNQFNTFDDVTQFVLNKRGRILFHLRKRNTFVHITRRLEWLGHQNSHTSRHGHFNIECLGNDQNIRKQNGRIQIIPTHRLHRTLRHVLWKGKHIEKAATRLCLIGMIFRKVASCLTKEPHGCFFHWTFS
mmetsp:Transcript_6724/g.12099  ORF Transcript_6724/g.12099 Transcript_6724/m.12099 type:complete len:203 (-) Transcript_6724:130-738(-)